MGGGYSVGRSGGQVSYQFTIDGDKDLDCGSVPTAPTGYKVEACGPEEDPVPAWEEEKMVLEAIYGAEACPTPIAFQGPNAVAVELPLPEGSLLSAIISAATAERFNDGDSDNEANAHLPSSCCLEFACPHGRPEGGSCYPGLAPLIAVSCSALPASCLRRMTRRLSRIAVAAASLEQPMIHDLVSSASEMLAGVRHQQQPATIGGGTEERSRCPLEESSDEDEGIRPAEEGDEDDEWDEENEVYEDGEEDEVDGEAAAAAEAAAQVVAGDLYRQEQLSQAKDAARTLTVGTAEDYIAGEEAGASLAEEFEGLAVGGDDPVNDGDTSNSEAPSRDDKADGGGFKRDPSAQQTRVKPALARPPRQALTAAAAEAEGHKLAEHQARLAMSGEHAAMRQQRSTLPASAKREELLSLLLRSSVVVISGATGCGKSTQVRGGNPRP